MFKHQLVVERTISTLDFCDYTFEGRTIYQGWERMFSFMGHPYTLMVQEFYSELQLIDTNANEWEVVIRRVRVKISFDILSHYLGI